MVYLIGAGGHARVVLDAMIANGQDVGAVTIRDGNPRYAGTRLMNIPIHSPEIEPEMAGAMFHAAIGAGEVRARIHGLAKQIGMEALTITHRGAQVSRFASIAGGSFIAAAAVVGPAASIGTGSIINHGAIVDHDCSVGAFCHIAPNATLSGGVTIGDLVLVGAGAIVLPGVNIGERATIGAGAVVLRDVGPGEKWTGVPASKTGL